MNINKNDIIDSDDITRLLESDGSMFDDSPDSDWACALLDHINYSSQLDAIKTLVQRNIAHENALEACLHEQQHPDDYGDVFYRIIYEDAAHSMAAVGMLAPFIESVFHQAFLSMKGLQSLNIGNHPRFQKPPKHQWDCRYFWDNPNKIHKNLIKGICQLADIVGLNTYLPKNYYIVLTALFIYRNSMFHNGFEWSVSEIQCFKDKISKAPAIPLTWFSFTTRNKEPWICYMTKEFIDTCILMVDDVISALGRFARTNKY